MSILTKKWSEKISEKNSKVIPSFNLDLFHFCWFRTPDYFPKVSLQWRCGIQKWGNRIWRVIFIGRAAKRTQCGCALGLLHRSLAEDWIRSPLGSHSALTPKRTLPELSTHPSSQMDQRECKGTPTIPLTHHTRWFCHNVSSPAYKTMHALNTRRKQKRCRAIVSSTLLYQGDQWSPKYPEAMYCNNPTLFHALSSPDATIHASSTLACQKLTWKKKKKNVWEKEIKSKQQFNAQ